VIFLVCVLSYDIIRFFRAVRLVKHRKEWKRPTSWCEILPGVSDDTRFGGGTVQEQLARIYVMSLLHTHVLGRDVKVAHSLLQWRALIKRTAAACSKTCIDDTNTGRGDPNRCLRALCQESIIIQRSGKRVAPVSVGLGFAKGPRCSEFSFDTAEFALEYFRSPHRHGGPLLLPPSIGELDEFVERALGHTDGEGAVQQRNKLQHGLIERPRLTWSAVHRIKGIRRWDQRVTERDMMAARTLEPCDVPGVLDLPVARRQHEAPSIGRPSVPAGPGIGFFRSVTMQNPRIQSACWQPLMNGHRPLIRQPPGTASAIPAGWAEAAIIMSGPFRYT
jgi:hypothetical protein